MTQVYSTLNHINWISGCWDIGIRKGIELFCVVQDFCLVTVPSFSRMAPGQPGYGWFDIKFWWYKQSIWITVGYHVGWLWNREVQRVCLSHWYSSKKTLTILISWTRFLVVITTHADPRTSFLHTAPGNTGSVSVEEVSFNSFSITSPLSLRREDLFITLDLNEIFSVLTQNFAFPTKIDGFPQSGFQGL